MVQTNWSRYIQICVPALQSQDAVTSYSQDAVTSYDA